MIVKNKLLNFDKVIYQDSDYFKMSLDSVLLANFVTINLKDKNILDIATGNAPIPMLLSYRTKAKIYGIELQKEIYSLGIKSIKENKMEDQIILINDDAKNYSNYFESDSFDVIVSNPPYFNTIDDRFINDNEVKSIARHEKYLNIEDVLRISKNLLKNGGRVSFVHRTERLMELLFLMKKYNIEPKKIRFVYPNKKKNSDLVLIEGTKNGKSGLKILNPLFVYEDDGSYTNEVYRMYGDNDAK